MLGGVVHNMHQALPYETAIPVWGIHVRIVERDQPGAHLFLIRVPCGRQSGNVGEVRWIEPRCAFPTSAQLLTPALLVTKHMHEDALQTMTALQGRSAGELLGAQPPCRLQNAASRGIGIVEQ